jgi:hypothetical protein
MFFKDLGWMTLFEGGCSGIGAYTLLLIEPLFSSDDGATENMLYGFA